MFRHFSRLRLAARVPFSPQQVRRLLEMRDIAELYELWCFFSVVGALREQLGPPRSAEILRVGPMQMDVPWDFQVSWPQKVRLFYNPRFSRSKAASRRSYSVPLRRDIALEVPDGPNAGLHLFDAKFRLERLDAIVPEVDAVDDGAEVEDERRGTFKRGDLYKMHTYRDAIRGTRSVWVLYPGSTAKFFAEHGDTWSPTSAVPDELDGVGAVPLLPGTRPSEALMAVLARLMSDSRTSS